MLNHQYLPQYPQNIISGQILQANGLSSVKSIKMAPNASAIVADTTLPIIYKCTSDSLGNVSTQIFDILPHKTEEEVKAETMENRIGELEKHVIEIENILRNSNPSA